MPDISGPPGKSRSQPTQQIPSVQRLRIRYAKRGRARFTSHRDFGRAFERALRRAEIPMAYSSGFSPHPRISYANASPTGAASEAEYLEIGVTAVCDPDKVREALDAALPPGLDVLQVTPSPGGALADLLTGSIWRIEMAGVPSEVLRAGVEEFLGRPSVEVERMTKSGLRTFDARTAVIALTVEPYGLRLVSAHQTPLVRPDDVLAALARTSPACTPPEVPILTRQAQGLLDPESATVADPLAAVA